jgi:hypothetical protein
MTFGTALVLWTRLSEFTRIVCIAKG